MYIVRGVDGQVLSNVIETKEIAEAIARSLAYSGVNATVVQYGVLPEVEEVREASMQPGRNNEAYQRGREIGAAFAAVFQVRVDASAAALTGLGMIFASYEGFSDMRVGGAFVPGFCDGAESGGLLPKLGDGGGVVSNGGE